MNQLSFPLLLWLLFFSFVVLISSDEDGDGLRAPGVNDADQTIKPSIEEDPVINKQLVVDVNPTSNDDTDDRVVGPGVVDAGSNPVDAEADIGAGASQPTNILIFGGNGLLGAAAVEKLLTLKNGANIYLGVWEETMATTTTTTSTLCV